MTKINEALNEETLQDVRAKFAETVKNAIEDIKATFESAVVEAYQKGVTHGMTLGMSVEHTKPKYKTVKRAAKVGERILITNPMDDSAGRKGEVFNVTNVSLLGSVDVEEIRVNSGVYAFTQSEYEVIIEPEQTPVKELTPNEQRAALIEKAREFVKKYCNSSVYPYGACKSEFFTKGNKVTCVMRGLATKKVRTVGRAKCMPDEVFNADIGKAIALARALEIDVPSEFRDAVQPDEVVVGMEVYCNKHSFGNAANEFCEVFEKEGNGFFVDAYNPNRKDKRTWVLEKQMKIINDTNAIYEVAK